MKTTLIQRSFAVVGSTVVVLACAGSALAASKPSAITLQLTSKLQHFSQVDNPPTGQSAGDLVVFTERLLNASGQVVGSDAASCVYLFDARLLCTGAYILHAGQIQVQLVQPGLASTGVYTQAITGGTGRYAGATGTVTLHEHAAGDRFTFHIQLPAT
jgi:hypothetical protein